MKRTPLLRKTPLRSMSKKRQRMAPKRRELVEQLLETYPWCLRCWVERAVDCHELKRRSQGGDPLDPTGIVTLCRPCHTWVTEHPIEAREEGLTRWSWEDVKPVTVPDPLSPDCEVAKHQACSGDAWDLLKDEPAACTCSCHPKGGR